MNECFFIGNVIEIGKFKFIVNSKIKYKSKITMKIKLLDGNIINGIAYNEVADYILRNNFLKSTVFIQGILRNKTKELQINIYNITKVKF